MAPGRPRLGVTLRWVLAAYFVALAAMPFAHHDVVCHLKSSTHCATCHVGTSGDQSNVRPSLARVALEDAGQAEATDASVAASWALVASAGRAPPAR